MLYTMYNNKYPCIHQQEIYIYISMGMHGGKIKVIITFTNHWINIQHNTHPLCIYIHIYMVGHYIPVYTTKNTVEVYSADSAFCRKVDGKIK